MSFSLCKQKICSLLDRPHQNPACCSRSWSSTACRSLRKSVMQKTFPGLKAGKFFASCRFSKDRLSSVGGRWRLVSNLLALSICPTRRSSYWLERWWCREYFRISGAISSSPCVFLSWVGGQPSSSPLLWLSPSLPGTPLTTWGRRRQKSQPERVDSVCPWNARPTAFLALLSSATDCQPCSL